MRPSTFLPFALAAIASSVHAQMIHDITVGDAQGTPVFTPNNITANIGDIVRYTFNPKNHTVTQSSLPDPCTPLPSGFDSGFMPVPIGSSSTDFPTFNITVKDTTPIWVFCKQTGHCPNSGMVMAVNGGSKFDQFVANAKALGTSGSSTTAAPPSTATPPPTSPPTSPPSNSPTTHMVEVGANGTLTYSSSNITANPGDQVTFKFLAKNHTVTQSTFSTPCRKIGDTTSKQGFNSGFMPVAANATDFPTFTITVNDTAPIWVYCAQTNPVPHCGMGMVFAVNANESSPNNFDAFVALAKQQNGTSSTSGGGSSGGSGSGGNSTGSTGKKNAAPSLHTNSAFVVNAAMVVLGIALFSGLN